MAEQDKQKDETGEAAGKASGKPEAKKAADSASRRESAVPGVKRPPHTIDLKADEVKEDEDAGRAPAEPEKKERKAEDRASASASAAKPSGKSADKADTKSGSSAPKAPAGARKEPPQRTTPAQVTGFVTHLAAGLLGGVAGVIGAGYLLPHVAQVGGVSQGYRQSVDSRIAALESRLGTVESNAASGTGQEDIGKRIAGLGQRLDASGRELETLKQASAAMGERLDRMESTLKAMEETAAKGGDVAQTAAIRAQVGEMTSAMESRIAALQGDVDALSRKLADAGEAATAGQAARLDALQREIGVLRDQASSASEAHGGGAAVSIRLAALARAAEEGRGYAAELQALREIAPEGVDLSVLDSWAEQGVPTLAELQRRFPAARKAALNAVPRAQGGSSIVDQLIESAGSVVKIRRVGGGATGPAAVLAEMEAKLNEGNLRAVVTRAEAEGLPEQSRQTLGAWLEQARARIALDAALGKLSDELARRLAAGGQAR